MRNAGIHFDYAVDQGLVLTQNGVLWYGKGQLLGRDYRPWGREHLVIDTAGRTVEQCVSMLRAALPAEPLVV